MHLAKPLQYFCRASHKVDLEADRDVEEPIGLASDGEADAELAKLLSELDEASCFCSI